MNEKSESIQRTEAEFKNEPKHPIQYSYLKLFICDIFDLLKEKATSDNGLTFRGLPVMVKKVNIFGTVLEVIEYEERILYKIDDNTGVIMCSWWKPHEKQMDNLCAVNETLSGTIENVAATSKNQLLKSLITKLIMEEECRLRVAEVGENLHVLGTVKEFRGQLQIDADICYAVNDHNTETQRILEQLILYKHFYS